MRSAFREKLVKSLELNLPYSERVLSMGGRPAAILLLIGYSGNGDEIPSILITRRTDTVGSHKGQMAFPGGMSEPDEMDEESGVARTALRETEEEVGILPANVEVLGVLPTLTTITDFRVTPVVGVLTVAIEDAPLKLNTYEIAEAFWVPLTTLLSPETYKSELKRFGEIDYPIHVYQVNEHRIWGATGSMIKNLLDRLASLG